MTNYEKWYAYTSGLPSPDNYINWGYLYLISAALQRRVFMGPIHQPCFPNMYVIFVGAPGIGKGLVIREISEFLKFWKLEYNVPTLDNTKSPEEKAQAEMLIKKDLEHAQEIEQQGKSKGAEIIKPLLIPVCADAITYQALVDAVGGSYRRINYAIWDEKEGKFMTKVYGHSSLCFVLQELASLMRKQTNDVVNYLLGLYDCPMDYEYVSLNRGKDRVRRGCLNLLAGTTPSFMQSTFDDRLVDEGFSSRTFYIYATKNRKNRFRIPYLSKEQESYKIDLLAHVKNLTRLYGNITIGDDVWEFLENWWNETENNKGKRKNKSTKMTPYYSRKNIHVMKVAMAMHFGESLDMTIPLETFQRAIEFLEKEELNMHLALTLEGNSPAAKVCKKILEMLGNGPKNFVDVLTETYTMSDKRTIEECVNTLQLTNQIEIVNEIDKDTEQSIVFYMLKE